ncbi:flavin-containing monooxygenase [Pseudonocardia sp. GCM10023141]|uniref:flavin-containing monooxygenase n=1 Tax=Pseudonocardia sp. GCM10023141 TaxID=3252653 RepID=UPI00361BF496
MSEKSPSDSRVCVVGAGPSGLVMARAALQAGAEVVVYERHTDVGGIWDPENPGSPIYESAHFISSRYTSGFYGFPMPESFPDYPGYKLLRDFIREFAATFGLYDVVRLGTGVQRAEQVDGGWVVTDTDGRSETFTHLVCANGVTWHPRMPDYPGLDTFTGEYRHSSTFRHAREFDGKRVLVVGGGNSGVDIACDAARNADAAFWSVRRGYRVIPKHIFGVPLDVFINEGGRPPEGVTVPEDPSALIDALVGDLSRFGLPKADHAALESHPIVNDAIVHHLTHGDIAGKPDVARLRGDTVEFTDGSTEQVDLVLFATGYDYDIAYVDPSLFEWRHGHPELYLNMFNREIDNLYVLGFIEFADAAYHRFDEMAQLIAFDVVATGARKQQLSELKRTDAPDLRGGMHYIDSPRHASYVETHTFQHALAAVRERFGLEALTETTFDALRRDPLEKAG